MGWRFPSGGGTPVSVAEESFDVLCDGAGDFNGLLATAHPPKGILYVWSQSVPGGRVQSNLEIASMDDVSAANAFATGRNAIAVSGVQIQLFLRALANEHFPDFKVGYFY